jgi:hypothetical protein
MNNFGLTKERKRNTFPFWLNYKIEMDFELQIQLKMNFEFHLNFKGLQTFWEKQRNSPILYLGRIFKDIILDDPTCIQKFKVFLQAANGL